MVYFKVSCGVSYMLNVFVGIKEGSIIGWININSDNDNKCCVKKIVFFGYMVYFLDMVLLKIIGDD